MSRSDHTIGCWLSARAALTPDRVAIDFNDRQVTYRELAEAVTRRAARFAGLGLKPGDRVATLAKNCPEQVEVFFACAASGLIMVPLNWRLTAAELAWQIDNAIPAVLLTDPQLDLAGKAASQQSASSPPVTLLTAAAAWPGGQAARDRDVIAGSAPSAGPVAVDDDDPLLVLYTSGTTGRPKGAVLTHANCFWTNLSLDRTAEMSGGDVVLQVLPQCHVGGWNVQPLLAWWKGATVVLEQTFDAARALTLIAAKRVTTMMGVPTNYLMLAASEGFATADLSSLRQVIVGGAPMPRPLIDTWLARGVTVLQGYGLTEAAPNVLCVPPEYAQRKAGSAGRPYLHVQVALRDMADTAGSGSQVAGAAGDRAGRGPVSARLVEGAGVGELIIAGPNVFTGYWQNPDASAAALRGGWLGTGDVAERDAEGFYWIRGRLKEMYISGGENVYPAEVEGVLTAHEAIAQAAVIGLPDERWGETGLAFIVLDSGHELSGEELDAYCRARLAAYKVPRQYRIIAELPYLSTGKVDKRWLAVQARAASGERDGR
jgi:fatty-acyl-CoA synthase